VILDHLVKSRRIVQIVGILVTAGDSEERARRMSNRLRVIGARMAILGDDRGQRVEAEI